MRLPVSLIRTVSLLLIPAMLAGFAPPASAFQSPPGHFSVCAIDSAALAMLTPWFTRNNDPDKKPRISRMRRAIVRMYRARPRAITEKTALQAAAVYGFFGGAVSLGGYFYLGWNGAHLAEYWLVSTLGWLLLAAHIRLMVPIARGALEVWQAIRAYWKIGQGFWAMLEADTPANLIPPLREFVPVSRSGKREIMALARGHETIRAELINDLRRLPTRWQWVYYALFIYPLRFFHLRPLFWTPLNRLGGWLHDAAAQSLLVLIPFSAAAGYAQAGATGLFTGLAGAAAIHLALHDWGRQRQKETYRMNHLLEEFVRRQDHPGNGRFNWERREEILHALERVADLLGRQPRDLPGLLQYALTTDLLHPDRLSEGRDAVTIVFDGAVLRGYPGDTPFRIAVTVSEDYTAVTAVTAKSALVHRILGKGGARYEELSEGSKEFNQKFKGMMVEAARLSERMAEKNPWSGILFQGGKTVFLARTKEGLEPADRIARKKEIIQSWTASSIRAGMLLTHYLAGPDVNTGSGKEMAWIVEEADRVQRQLGRRPILATTSRPVEQGGYPHEAWMVTSLTTMEAILTALTDDDFVAENGIPLEGPITWAVQGYGDVGSGLFKYLHELRTVNLPARIRELRSLEKGAADEVSRISFGGRLRFVQKKLAIVERMTLIAVSDKFGGIKNIEGLNTKELLECREQITQGIKEGQDPKSLALNTLYKETHDPVGAGEVLFLGADIVIPAALGDVIQQTDEIDLMKSLGTKVYAEAGNNTVVIGLEPYFAQIKLGFLPGAPNNFGGVGTSEEEWLDRTFHGEEWVRRNGPAQRDRIRDRLTKIQEENMAWLLQQHKATGRSFLELHAEAVEKIRNEIANLFKGPTEELIERVQSIRTGLQAMVAESEWAGEKDPVFDALLEKVSYMRAAVTLAREKVLKESLAVKQEDPPKPPFSARRIFNSIQNFPARMKPPRNNSKARRMLGAA